MDRYTTLHNDGRYRIEAKTPNTILMHKETIQHNEGNLKYLSDYYYVAGAAVDKLAEYENAAEQSLLVTFPCKVGDDVWLIDIDRELIKCKIIQIGMCFTEDNINEHHIYVKYDNTTYHLKLDLINKNWFLTETEALQALKNDINNIKKEDIKKAIDDMQNGVSFGVKVSLNTTKIGQAIILQALQEQLDNLQSCKMCYHCHNCKHFRNELSESECFHCELEGTRLTNFSPEKNCYYCGKELRALKEKE